MRQQPRWLLPVAEGHHTERSYDSVDPSDQLSEATMQVGIDSFAAAFEESSRAVGPSDRLRQLVEQIEHADQVGLDAFGIGEHHRREFLDSAPAIILAAAAARTNRIRLTSAVTVLSAADPVRVFQSFATLDLLSQDTNADRVYRNTNQCVSVRRAMRCD